MCDLEPLSRFGHKCYIEGEEWNLWNCPTWSFTVLMVMKYGKIREKFQSSKVTMATP